jgi:hypothetical protein
MSVGWERDARLLADLRVALAGPGGPGFTDSALAAFRIGRGGGPAGLAELLFDSAFDPEPAGRLRASSSTRLLAFRADGYALDLEIGEDGLLGQVHPDGSGPVPGGTVTGEGFGGVFGAAELDEVGGFALPRPAPGPVRLRARLGDRAIVTSWLLLRYPTD